MRMGLGFLYGIAFIWVVILTVACLYRIGVKAGQKKITKKQSKRKGVK